MTPSLALAAPSLVLILLTPPLLGPLHPDALLFLEPRPRLLVRLAQYLLADERADQDRQRAHGRVEDPHLLQAVGVGDVDYVLLVRGQRLEELGVGAGARGGELADDVTGQDGREVGGLVCEDVGEDNAAEDNGDGGAELADEAEGARRGGDVLGLDGGLQRDQRALKVGSDADAGDDLVDDDFGPVGPRVQVDEEAEAERHEDEAEPDGFAVAAGLFDDDADQGGLEG